MVVLPLQWDTRMGGTILNLLPEKWSCKFTKFANRPSLFSFAAKLVKKKKQSLFFLSPLYYLLSPLQLPWAHYPENTTTLSNSTPVQTDNILVWAQNAFLCLSPTIFLLISRPTQLPTSHSDNSKSPHTQHVQKGSNNLTLNSALLLDSWYQ